MTQSEMWTNLISTTAQEIVDNLDEITRLKRDEFARKIAKSTQPEAVKSNYHTIKDDLNHLNLEVFSVI